MLQTLPTSVELITLSHEEPIPPALQVAKRRWPDSYLELAKDSSNKMELARALLDDYTKGDSAIWRFLTLHWNRHHTDEIARLVYYIDKELIHSTNDLLDELEQIKPENPEGSLARRFSFLAYHKPKLHEKQEASGKIEMRTFSSQSY